jgi:hypothetical protein
MRARWGQFYEQNWVRSCEHREPIVRQMQDAGMQARAVENKRPRSPVYSMRSRGTFSALGDVVVRSVNDKIFRVLRCKSR